MAEKLLITSTVSLRKSHSPIWLQRYAKLYANIWIYGILSRKHLCTW